MAGWFDTGSARLLFCHESHVNHVTILLQIHTLLDLTHYYEGLYAELQTWNERKVSYDKLTTATLINDFYCWYCQQCRIIIAAPVHSGENIFSDYCSTTQQHTAATHTSLKISTTTNHQCKVSAPAEHNTLYHGNGRYNSGQKVMQKISVRAFTHRHTHTNKAGMGIWIQIKRSSLSVA